MKTIKLSILTLLFSSLAFAQFETPKSELKEFDGVNVEVGGGFALQFQGLKHENVSGSLQMIGKDINLPTANLDIRAYLADGMTMYLRNYMSSRHHNEAWVMGGHLRMDNLDFISEGFLSELMDIAYLRVGYDMPNYGDTWFRRTDNGYATANPFVGNYIMDAFTTEPFAELNIMAESGFIGVFGITNGKLNQSVKTSSTSDYGASLYTKLGFDKQINDDLRVRLTGSLFTSSSTSNGGYLFSGDRAGARYYWVMVEDGASDNFRSGRLSPGYKQHTATQIAPFVKVGDLEFYGLYEIDKDKSDNDGKYTQTGADLVYRFGTDKKLYLATRLNQVKGNKTAASAEEVVNRFNLSTGWYITPNVLAKLDLVTQKYSGAAYDGTALEGGKFNGVVLETAITF